MATASDIIQGALRRIQVISAETPIEADEIQDGLEDLNDWASALEVGTIALGFVPLAETGDIINIPREAEGMYKDNLAIYMGGQYGAPIPQSLVISASKSMNAVLNAFQRPINPSLPDTLPIGSGNQCYDNIDDRRFFNQNQKENF